jgi:hypothetical protein
MQKHRQYLSGLIPKPGFRPSLLSQFPPPRIEFEYAETKETCLAIVFAHQILRRRLSVEMRILIKPLILMNLFIDFHLTSSDLQVIERAPC